MILVLQKKKPWKDYKVRAWNFKGDLLTRLTLVEVAALARAARSLGDQNGEVSRLAELAEAAGGAADTAGRQGAALARRGVALDEHRVLGAAGRELHLAPGLGAVGTGV